MSYDYTVVVRVVGTRNGYTSTVVDSPTFCLLSNAQFGSIYGSVGDAEAAVRRMFEPLLAEDDELFIDIGLLE